jgi:hypothetical protein
MLNRRTVDHVTSQVDSVLSEHRFKIRVPDVHVQPHLLTRRLFARSLLPMIAKSRGPCASQDHPAPRQTHTAPPSPRGTRGYHPPRRRLPAGRRLRRLAPHALPGGREQKGGPVRSDSGKNILKFAALSESKGPAAGPGIRIWALGGYFLFWVCWNQLCFPS